MPHPGSIYAKWTNRIPEGKLDSSIVSYSGVNLDDPNQRGRLFSLLRFNMDVIDFWLSHLVFPQELKIFEKKLMCTAWDLCSDELKHRVTGFSGTNDTKNMLPITIAQNDLSELENTNARMRQTLLKPANLVYDKPANMSGKQILQELVKLNIPVLLDSGALMLELNNKEVAVEWLKLAAERRAAVYFDEHNVLQTIDRNGTIAELDYSVYRDDLSNCVAYLDDAHTRGTDMKFPPDCRACVTLSGDITRDKTVQSCMRMRKLADGQSILFWASNEANIRLRELSNGAKVETKHVMEFIENNSRIFEKANMVHWTTGALNYTKKLIGHKINEANGTENALQQLYNACVDNDFVKLSTMYGEKEEALLFKIAWAKFNKLEFECIEMEQEKVSRFVDRMKREVMKKLQIQAKDVKRFTHALDEEQEKELEQEIEEQTQVERPPHAKAAVPIFDKRLEKLVVEGAASSTFNEMKGGDALLSMGKYLTNTHLLESQFCENNEMAWANHLFVTKDFATIVQDQSQATNNFLRAGFWIACVKNPPYKDILILLSSFECNHLLPAFRQSVNATLFMYRPRISNLHSNLIHETGLQVTGMATPLAINAEDEIQIGVCSGLLYFADEVEQRVYCGFLGLIPRPWDEAEEIASKKGIIDDNRFVAARKRGYPEASELGVKKCKFDDNPTDLVIDLINAHHQILPKNSHAASILNRGIKPLGGQANNAMEVE